MGETKKEMTNTMKLTAEIEIDMETFYRLCKYVEMRYGRYHIHADQIKYALGGLIDMGIKIVEEEAKKKNGTFPKGWEEQQEIKRMDLRCIRANCGKVAVHSVKSEHGYFGVGYCEEHWKDRDTKAEASLLME